MNFNQHTYELRKKLMSYTDAMRQDETMRDIAERKPSQYRISIIGFGLQGEKIAEYMALQRDNELANSINAVRAFKRRVRPLMEDERGKVAEPEFSTHMHQLQKGAVSGRIEPKILEYFFIQELYAVHGITDYLLQAGTPNPMSDILVVCPRYGFPDVDISSSALEKAAKSGDEATATSIHRTRANLAATFPHLDSYRDSVPGLIKAMSETLEDVLSKKEKIDRILARGIEEEKFVKRDTVSISDHIIGAEVLGDWLNAIGYQGFLITIPNPLDIFTYATMSHSGLPPSRVIGVENHDQTRFTYAFSQNLAKSETIHEHGATKPRYTFTEVNIPMFGQHNYSQRPNLERARFTGTDHLTGKSFYSVGLEHFKGDHEKRMIESLEFSARDYIKHFKDIPQGTGIETGDAAIQAINAIIMSSDLPEFRQRVAGYTVHKGQAIVDGIQARLSYRGAHQVMHWDRASEAERPVLVRGAEQIAWLVNELGDAGLLNMLTVEEGMRREKAYTKRWQHGEYKIPEQIHIQERTEQKKESPRWNFGKTIIKAGRDVNMAETIYIEDKK